MERLLRLSLPVLALLALVGAVAYMALLRLEVLPRQGFAPGWALVDQDGAWLTSEDLRGGVTLYTFTHSGCQTPCPETGRPMREVQDRLADLETGAIPVRLVTMVFDPAARSPATLGVMAKAQGANPEVWTFATGDSTVLRAAIGGGFGVYYNARADGGYDFDPVYVLVDGLGTVRATYRFGSPDAESLVRGIRSLLREAGAADGPARLAYEAAHLFSCYSGP